MEDNVAVIVDESAPIALTVSSAVNVPVIPVTTIFVGNVNVGGLGESSKSFPCSTIFIECTLPISVPYANNLAPEPLLLVIDNVGKSV